MVFKSELESSNPLLYTSLFLLGFFPTFNLIALSYYGGWESPLLLHWVMYYCKLSVLLGFSSVFNIWLLQVHIIVGPPPYFRVLLLWAFDACYLNDLIKALCQAIFCIIWWF